MIPIASGQKMPALGTVVDKITFSFDQCADITPPKPESRLKIGGKVAVILRIRITFAALFHGIDQFHGFAGSLGRQAFTEDMSAGLECLYSRRSMFVGIIGDYHGINVCFCQHFPVIRKENRGITKGRKLRLHFAEQWLKAVANS